MSGPRAGLARLGANMRAGRLQRTLSLVVGLSSAPLAFEIYLEHYKGSFGDRLEWTPIALTPPLLAAGIAGAFSERAAKTALPAASLLYGLDGALGTVLHARGVQRRPGGTRELTYNLVMGPPLLAPGSLVLVGALGVLAAFVPRER